MSAYVLGMTCETLSRSENASPRGRVAMPEFLGIRETERRSRMPRGTNYDLERNVDLDQEVR